MFKNLLSALVVLSAVVGPADAQDTLFKEVDTLTMRHELEEKGLLIDCPAETDYGKTCLKGTDTFFGKKVVMTYVVFDERQFAERVDVVFGEPMTAKDILSPMMSSNFVPIKLSDTANGVVDLIELIARTQDGETLLFEIEKYTNSARKLGKSFEIEFAEVKSVLDGPTSRAALLRSIPPSARIATANVDPRIPAVYLQFTTKTVLRSQALRAIANEPAEKF